MMTVLTLIQNNSKGGGCPYFFNDFLTEVTNVNNLIYFLPAFVYDYKKAVLIFKQRVNTDFRRGMRRLQMQVS